MEQQIVGSHGSPNQLVGRHNRVTVKRGAPHVQRFDLRPPV